ncbi:M16 family metallopeptidase [Thermocatellispora tengchongensis]|uniref:M16 family metallopeptidase n=1 Tax=Thermocatellispora tengchongensis TaxID=1073253 RepID=UPI00362704C1
MPANHLSRWTLPNGLRVLVEHRPGAPRAAVCVHYGVGYRSERPSREGFAHLFEHLMFRGSENLPDGRFFDHIHRLGGNANGTTHQDYTDYHQIVPAEALEQALFSEADRMRAPRFTEETLARQLDGIEMEIHDAVTGRPYGGFPWPLLPGVLFRRFANAHDGYGRLNRLRRTTLADCAEFFDTHYAPGNAIVTVIAGHPAQDVLALVERHFGDIAPRPVPPLPDLREPELDEDRWVTYTEPGVSATAIALGYRLPDPAADLPGYLAHAVLAEMIGHQGADLPEVYALSASCGVFGPLDARSPDALVITALVAPEAEPRRTVRTLTERWSAWAGGIAPDQVRAQAVRRLVTEHHREHADMFARCRALGRMELLFGRAELLDEIPGLFEVVSRERVAAAARGLHTGAKGVLALVPGPLRTRPEPGCESDDPPSAEAPRSVAGPARGSAAVRPVPPLGVRIAPGHTPRRDVTLAGGMRVAAVRDQRTPLVELRLRLPVNAACRRHPEQVETLVRHLAARTGAVTRSALGGALEITTDGQWVDLAGYALAAGVPGWLSLLAKVLAPAEDAGLSPPAPPRHRDPSRVMDDALRRHLTHCLAPADPVDCHTLHSAITPGGGWFVAVGDIDPGQFVADLERVLPAGSNTSPTGSPYRRKPAKYWRSTTTACGMST